MRNFVISVAEYMENFTINFCKILQYALVLLIFVLLTAFSYFFINLLFKAQSNNKVTQLQLYIYLTIGIWLLFNIVFNYVVCFLKGPGHPQDIKSQRFVEEVQKRCKKCSARKPQRCHHCSLCGKCVLQMDHHCPWMGTCIGHQNRRFFVNFLTYLNSGIILILILLKHTSATRENRDVSTFLFVLFLTLGMFCLFHWLLVFSGRTTLEICFIDDGYRPRCNFRKNLIIVFGTANVLKIFLPINRTLPYEGFEWEDEDIWASDRPKMNEKIPSNDDI